eukprot:2174365-Pleurochrysis_carterae.AAC.1
MHVSPWPACKNIDTFRQESNCCRDFALGKLQQVWSPACICQHHLAARAVAVSGWPVQRPDLGPAEPRRQAQLTKVGHAITKPGCGTSANALVRRVGVSLG